MLRCPRPRPRRLQSPRSAPLHFVQQTRSAQRNQKENPHNKCRDQFTSKSKLNLIILLTSPLEPLVLLVGMASLGQIDG